MTEQTESPPTRRPGVDITAEDSGFGVGALFQLLRDGQPRTRAQLAAETGLARSTIAQRVDALIAADLIGPADKAASSGGRPPAMFAFNPSARVVLAADIGASHASVAITDLSGTLIAQRNDDLPVASGPEKVLDWVAEQALQLVAESGRSTADVAGLGIGLPGPVEHSTGRPVNPPI
ncbi:sugar kinase, partial [Phytoactinopolyspora halophila]